MNSSNHVKALLGLLLITTSLYAQNGGTLINANGLLPTTNSPAVLEVASTTKGMLIPRMTAAQRNGIASPVLGLLVYQTNSPVGLWSYTGNGWEQIGTGSGSGSGWGLLGNAGTNPVSNFVGTTDNQSLRFRVNNIQSGEIHPMEIRVWVIMYLRTTRRGFPTRLQVRRHLNPIRKAVTTPPTVIFPLV